MAGARRAESAATPGPRRLATAGTVLAKPRGMSATVSSPSPLAGTCVLVVDDDPQSAKLISILLRPELCHVQVAPDATTALGLLVAGLSASLVVLDLKLPDMSGLDLARALRTLGRTRELPLVAMSASGPEYGEHSALAAGCNGFVAKPIDPDGFVRALLAQKGRGL
jgi:two-component system cell cycle response regulator DivK